MKYDLKQNLKIHLGHVATLIWWEEEEELEQEVCMVSSTCLRKVQSKFLNQDIPKNEMAYFFWPFRVLATKNK